MIRRDMRWRRFSSAALWVPAIWLALGSSHGISYWFYQLGLASGGSSNRLDGSPVNIVFNNGVFIIAILILISRRFNWVQYAFSNKGLFLFYGFFLFSALWSPFPVPTVKRWVQEFGWLLIVPIVLTEPDPAASLRVMFVRVSYILFPLSVVLMRYFPNIGRVDSFHGSEMLSGVADHKNSLGQLCFVFCLVLLWDLIETRKSDTTSAIKPEPWTRLVNLGIGLYLLNVASSATSLLCFLFGIVLLVVGKRLAAMKNAKLVFILGVLAIVSVLALQQTFHLSGQVSEAFGRGSDMTGRGEIWQAALNKHTNYLFGAGFRGFWETSAGKEVYEQLGTGELITVHNGYLETYLNGGVVGLCFLGVFLWSTGLITTTKLVERDPIGRLAVVFWPLILIYNMSESQFMMTGPVWYAMLLVTTVVLHRRREEAAVRVKMAGQERQPPPQLRGRRRAVATQSGSLSERHDTKMLPICQA
jgi:exopolysaccharide production protein ExoQ